MSVCKTCGASIIWVKTTKGKDMPLDARKLSVFVIDPAQSAEGKQLAIQVTGYESHFATCVDADLHRKRDLPKAAT